MSWHGMRSASGDWQREADRRRNSLASGMRGSAHRRALRLRRGGAQLRQGLPPSSRRTSRSRLPTRQRDGWTALSRSSGIWRTAPACRHSRRDRLPARPSTAEPLAQRSGRRKYGFRTRCIPLIWLIKLHNRKRPAGAAWKPHNLGGARSCPGAEPLACSRDLADPA